MSGRSWSASGRRPRAVGGSAGRPAGSWAAAVERARFWWDELAGGPTVTGAPDVAPGELVALGPDDDAPARMVYTEAAAAAILSTALGLWADTAASMGAGDDGSDSD